MCALQGPAISFAYEKAEEAVMLRPPRDLVNDRLISRGLLFYSYVVCGISNMFISMFAYFAVFISHGIPSESHGSEGCGVKLGESVGGACACVTI